MKLKNLFITLGLTLAVGIGVGAGLRANNIKTARAYDIGGDTENYVYYVTKSGDPTGDKIHAWNGENAYDEWPGDAIASVGTDVTGVFNFEGSYKKIYKICFDVAPTGFMFTWGDGSNSESGGKTADFTFNSGRAYWWDGDVNGIASAGAAIDFIVEVEAARNTASAFQGHDYSICGIDADTAATLYNKYFALSADIKTMVDNSTTKTYNGKNGSGEYDWNESTNISFANIMQELKTIALNGGKVVSGSAKVLPTTSGDFNAIVLIAVATSFATLLSVGGFFLLKRKREN